MSTGVIGVIQVADAKDKLCFYIRLMYLYFKPAPQAYSSIATGLSNPMSIPLITCEH
jgi:hypothetical protein